MGVSMMIFSMSIPTFAKEISGEREEKQIVSMQQGSQVIGEETIRIFESDDMYQEKIVTVYEDGTVEKGILTVKHQNKDRGSRTAVVDEASYTAEWFTNSGASYGTVTVNAGFAWDDMDKTASCTSISQSSSPQNGWKYTKKGNSTSGNNTRKVTATAKGEFTKTEGNWGTTRKAVSVSIKCTYDGKITTSHS